MFENLPDLLTTKDVRSALQIGKNKTLELLENGELEGAFKLGHVWRIPRYSLINYINRH